MDKRGWVQTIASLISNSYIVGFIKGKIYTGKLKNICLPGLNCYSCPGAIGSCPIGAIQSVAGRAKYAISMYVLGFLLVVGTFFGRLICGWVCPFGWVQELLHKIPTKKIKIVKKVDKPLRVLKHITLAIVVIILPIATAGPLGISTPYFCKYICPAGTLEAGLPLVLANPLLRDTIGSLFFGK